MIALKESLYRHHKNGVCESMETVCSMSPSIPTNAPNTNSTQTITQASIAVRPSAFGMLVVMVLKMLTRTRKTVIRSVILVRSKIYLKLFSVFAVCSPSRHYIWRYEETDPTDNDKHSCKKRQKSFNACYQIIDISY